MSRIAPQFFLVPTPTAIHSASDTRLTAKSRLVVAADLIAEANILASAIHTRTGLELGVVDAASATPTDGDIVAHIADGFTSESYRIDTSTGSAVVSASENSGAFWGLQTIRQLLTQDQDGWFINGALIDDSPRFAYRGVMLDVARHFFGVKDVKRFIDAVSSLKFNVLHLHLTDDQGWRLHSEAYPALTDKSSGTASLGDTGGFYTAADYAEIIEYAANHHMTVVPEIDTPGHTHAVTLAYPEFTRDTVIMPSVAETAALYDCDVPTFGDSYTGWCVGFSSLKIGDAATDEFITEIFREVAAATPGPYVHLGGDESLGTSAEDFSTFISMASRAISETGKTPIAWHEAGKAEGLATGTIGQYWGYLNPQPGYADEARAFVDNGGSLIISPADASYLDMKPDADFQLGLVWANGPTSFEQAYSWEPTEVIDGIDAEQILGVEAPLWSETPRTIDDVFALVFPRASAIAEIAWSTPAGEHRTWESFRARVANLGPAWQAEKIPFHASEEISWIPA